MKHLVELPCSEHLGQAGEGLASAYDFPHPVLPDSDTPLFWFDRDLTVRYSALVIDQDGPSVIIRLFPVSHDAVERLREEEQR